MIGSALATEAPPVHRLNPGDAQALAGLHRRCFDHPWPAQDFDALLSQPHVFALGVAGRSLTPPNLAAAILLTFAADQAEVLTLCVDPAARRQGHARALTQAALTLATALGMGEMLLEVRCDNRPALALYEHAGFTPLSRRPGYYRTLTGPVDALVLWRSCRKTEP